MSPWLRCLEPFIDAETGDRRRPGDEWETHKERAEALDSGPLAVSIKGPGEEVNNAVLWENTDGRDLRTVFDVETGAPVVACLNVWNDLRALKETTPTWMPHVDRVIAVDGAYEGAPVETCGSTDGTVEWLRERDVVVVDPPDGKFWPDQVTKRNVYMEMLESHEVGFVVDADEFVTNAEVLQHLEPLDVGWVPYRKSIYVKPQNFPRLFSGAIKPRYEGRHYWIRTPKGRFITDCQTGGAGFEHVFVPVEIDNTKGQTLRSAHRRAADGVIRSVQQRREAETGPQQLGGRESLRILQVARLDAGMVVFRLHTAINSASPHTSVMAGYDRIDRDYEAPRQYHLTQDRTTLRKYAGECDIIHCHLSYESWDQLGIHTEAPVVIHHHGTMYRNNPEARNIQDARRADVRLVSNPELLRYDDNLHFLPNPVPVKRYLRLRERLYEADPDDWFRVGHSPSNRDNKGTDTFLRAIERLRRDGLKVRPVLIENETHTNCLLRKAMECDAFFDSFWLGMQCSGIEAGAMGIPVIAGDEHCRSYYRKHHHECPYVFAAGRSDLERAITELATNSAYRERCMGRVHEHVKTHHDYAAVVGRYLDILDEELDWRRRLSLGTGTRFLTRQSAASSS